MVVVVAALVEGISVVVLPLSIRLLFVLKIRRSRSREELPGEIAWSECFPLLLILEGGGG